MENNMMDNVNPVNPDTGAVKKMNFFQRLLGIIISPSETTKNLAEKPRVLFPILLYILGPVIGVVAGWSYIENTIRHNLDNSLSQQSVNLTPEMIDAAMNMYKVAIPIILPIVLLILWVVGTAVYFGLIKLFRGEGNFKHYLSISGYSTIITVLGFLISFAVSAISGQTLDLSLGVLVPDPSGSFALGFIKSLLGAIGVFPLWNLWVTSVGFSNVSKLGRGKIYGIVFGIYGFLYILLSLLAGVGTANM